MAPSTHIHHPHDHQHDSACGHTAIWHEDHVCYLHDGHLHCHEGGRVVEHSLSVTETNPDTCGQGTCNVALGGHHHGPGCGHEAVPHGDHVDYLVDGRLHHPHQGHCDDHGPVRLA
jgi:hypothetical protein